MSDTRPGGAAREPADPSPTTAVTSNPSLEFPTLLAAKSSVAPIHPAPSSQGNPVSPGWEGLITALAPLRARLIAHPLYAGLMSLNDVRAFMQQHVFAVWDFMSLLKALQRQLTSVELPWVPRGDGIVRRLINEIVLGEESDVGLGGVGYLSHFELYRGAMEQCGADGAAIDGLLAGLASGQNLSAALAGSGASPAAKDFVAETFALIQGGSLPAITAAFTLGREDVIPDMFTRLVADLSRQHGGRLSRLQDYLERHIQMDGERHGPMSAHMLKLVCGEDPDRWEAARAGAERALIARLALWDGILAGLQRRLQE